MLLKAREGDLIKERFDLRLPRMVDDLLSGDTGGVDDFPLAKSRAITSSARPAEPQRPSRVCDGNLDHEARLVPTLGDVEVNLY